jgi:hypothetical protein
LSGGDIRQQIDNDLVIRVKDADDDGYRLDLIVVDDEDNTLTRVEVHRDGVEILTNLQGQAAHGWYFKDDGKLQLPIGGDIVDSNGTSVLGGSGDNSYTPEDTDNWNDPAVNTVQAALDELAARITALQNYEIDGGNAYTPPQGELTIDGNNGV